MVSLKAEERRVFGKSLKEWRKKGKVPAIVYGPEIKESIPVFVDKEDFKKAFKIAHETDLIDLQLGNEKKSVLIKDVDFDPIKDEPSHVDFFMPRMDRPIETSVPLVFVGESPAVKNLGGVLVKVFHEIEVKGLPKNIPHQIEVPLDLLINLEDKIIVQDIKFPEGIIPLAKGEEVVALVSTPKKEEISEEAPSLEDIKVEKRGKKEEGEGEKPEEKNS